MGKINELFQPNPDAAPTPVAGKLVEVDPKGYALIDYKGNTLGPLRARTTITLPPSQAIPGQRLLIIFEDNDPSLPVIIGVIADKLVPNAGQTVTLPVGTTDAAVVDGKKVRLDAKEEIQLVCGKSSILLRSDGKVVIKGINILNRALESNKLKGARIGIN